MKEFWRKHWQKLVLMVALIAVAAGFVLVFSISTSPIYRDYYAYGGEVDGGDSLHFQSDGQNWLNGKLPYRDFFDHKGPIIFLVNMIGWWIGGANRYGIMVLQVVTLTITLYYVWKMSQLAKKSSLWGAISVVVTLVFMTSCYNVGNTVQEYNLPFIAIATYYLMRYFYQDEPREHNPWWAFIYGIAVGACLLLQMTHAIPIGAGVLVIVVMLITQKRWKNLWQNLAMGLAGILVMWVPFALYFSLSGAFGDFIYCTIGYNLSYAQNIGSWLHGMNGSSIRYFLATFVPFFCVGVATILAFVRKKRAYAAMLAITFMLEAYLFLSGSGYSQYAIPTLCQVAILLNEILLFEHKEQVRTLLYIAMIAIMAMLTYNQLTNRAETLVDQYNDIRAAGVSGIGYEKLLEENLDEISNSTFTAYGLTDMKGLYVRYKLIPYNKFFVIQNWCARFAEEIKKATREDFENRHAEYMLVNEDAAKDEAYGIEDVLRKYYKLIGKDGEYGLYRLKSEVIHE